MAFSVVDKCGDAQNSSPDAGDLLQSKFGEIGWNSTNANHHKGLESLVKTRIGQFA
jgi:hypothetical protein